MEIQNPVIKYRNARGWTRRQLATVLGKSYERVTALELGNLTSVPKAWRPDFEAAGINYDELVGAYNQFRAAQTAAARQALLAGK